MNSLAALWFWIGVSGFFLNLILVFVAAGISGANPWVFVFAMICFLIGAWCHKG